MTEEALIRTDSSNFVVLWHGSFFNCFDEKRWRQ